MESGHMRDSGIIIHGTVVANTDSWVFFYVIGNCDRLASVNQEAKLLAMCVRRNALFLFHYVCIHF